MKQKNHFSGFSYDWIKILISFGFVLHLSLIQFMEARVGDTILQETCDNRGRGLFIVTGKQAGEVLINECSSAIWISKSNYTTDCAYCCKHANESKPYDISCRLCKRVSYCSLACQEYDRNQHEFKCPFLVKCSEINLDDDAELCVNLCTSVVYFTNSKPAKFLEIMSQDGSSTVLEPEEETACNSAFQLFQQCPEGATITKELVFDLYKKDKACGFAIMKPPHLRLQESEQDIDEERESENKKMSSTDDNDNTNDTKQGDDEGDGEGDEWEDLDTESVVKGFGIYPYLSLINHSCLPNCIRWDVVDSPCDSDVTPQQRRGIHFRALNTLPAGAELLHSYLPVCWSLDERQEYLLDMFGFTCQCDRCITETVIEGRNGKKSTININSSDKKIYKQQYAYIQLYLEKHTCGENSCSGTLTPVVGFDESIPGYDLYECNVCLRKRSHADFLKAVNEMRRV